MVMISDQGGIFTSSNEKLVLTSLGDFPQFGRAIEGNITLSASTNINTTRSGSNTFKTRTVDAPVANITAISGTTLTVSVQAGVIGDFKSGDVCLVINQQGDATNSGNVGNWELVRLSADASGTTISVTRALAKIYGATTSNSVLTGQKINIYRLPEYKIVTLNSGGVLTASAWNGTWGGIVPFFAQNVITNGTGTISANGLGYRGGSVVGGRGEGMTAQYNSVGKTAIDAGGGGGGSANASNAGQSGWFSPAFPTNASVSGAGGGGAGGGGGGAGGGGGYGAAGSVGTGAGVGGSGGGAQGGNCPINAVPGNTGTLNGAGALEGWGGFNPDAINPKGPSGSPFGNMRAADGGASGSAVPIGTSAGGSIAGNVNLVTTLILGGGGGACGAGSNGGNGGTGLPWPVAQPPTTSGMHGGAGGGGGGGFAATTGGTGGAGGTGAPTTVTGLSGSGGSAGGPGGAGGGIVVGFIKQIPNGPVGISVLANGLQGSAGGAGGAGARAPAWNPAYGTTWSLGGGGGGGAGGGGSGGGAGGSIFLSVQTLGLIGSASASAGSGGAAGAAGAGGATGGPNGGPAYPANFSSSTGGAGSVGGAGGAGGVGRAHVIYNYNAATSTYSSSSPDGAGQFPGTSPAGFKQTL